MANIQKIHVNRFTKGQDRDVDPKHSGTESYRKGSHVRIIGDGKYGSLQNLPGTSEVFSSFPAHDIYNVMGHVNVRAQVISGSTGNIEDCVLFFISGETSATPEYKFYVYAFRIATGVAYKLYEETVTSSYMTAVVDSVVASSFGVDTVYFTSKVFEPRRILCYFDISNPTKTRRESELWRRYPLSPLKISNVIYSGKPTSGGPEGGEGGTSTSHKISIIQNGSITDDGPIYGPGDGRRWPGKYRLDNDSGAGDQFELDVSWSLSGYVDGDFETAIYGEVSIKVWNGTSYDELFGAVRTFGLGPVGANTSDSSSGSGTAQPISGAYNGNPILIELFVQHYAGTGHGSITANVNATAIRQVAGGDTYTLGSPVARTEQITF